MNLRKLFTGNRGQASPQSAPRDLVGEHVWVSQARSDSRLILPLLTDIGQDHKERALAAESWNHDGKSVTEDLCPRKIWNEPGMPPLKRLPELFYADGYWIVSARAAEVVRRFDLGGGALFPIADGVYQSDRQTRLAGEYFCWIFGNAKPAFLEQRSPNARPMSGAATRDWCKMPISMQDDELSVSAVALDGPAVWVDPRLFKSIFLCGPLGDALCDTGLRQAFRLFQCPVV